MTQTANNQEPLRVGDYVEVVGVDGEFSAKVLRVIDAENIVVQGTGLDTSNLHHGAVLMVSSSQISRPADEAVYPHVTALCAIA